MESLDGTEIPENAEKEAILIGGVFTDLVKKEIVTDESILNFAYNMLIDEIVSSGPAGFEMVVSKLLMGSIKMRQMIK